ncbi:XdhC/CoxI family protein [Nocardioides sp. WV_118_6]
MDDVLGSALPAWSTDEAVALATVVATRGSAPRPLGASLVVLPDRSVRGSVSGGCVEGDVYELAQEVLADGTPVLERYGFSDSDAFAVGLTCGGELDVYVQRIDRASFPELGAVLADIADGRPVAVATVIEHPDPQVRGRRLVVRPAGAGPAPSAPSAPSAASAASAASAPVAPLAPLAPVVSERADEAVTADALGLLAAGDNGVLTYGPDGERLDSGMRVFVHAWAPRARMIVFGAIDFAAAACRLGAFLGYEVTVCDARPVFATRTRFPDAHEVVVAWPHRYLAAERDAGRIDERTVLVVLTHDAKFDVPVLELALRLPVAYVGAMGSRRTHEDRADRLARAGVPPDRLARLHSPIGLDLGARTPEETAVSIAAEIIACRWGGSGEPLAGTLGAIHRG